MDLGRVSYTYLVMTVSTLGVEPMTQGQRAISPTNIAAYMAPKCLWTKDPLVKYTPGSRLLDQIGRLASFG